VKTIREHLVLVPCLIVSLYAGALEQHAANGLSNLPTAAKASISAAVGHDIRDYHARANGGSFDTRNLRQDLMTHFSPTGVEVRNGTGLWRIALRSYGYGDAMKIVKTAVPYACSNRVEYRRGALTEWYVNGPVGLEQGFTIAQRPGKANGQPLTLALALSGNLTATVDKQSTALSLTERDGKAALRYTGLTATEATGRRLRAWLEVRGKQLLLKADDTNARYPVVIDPWVQLAELTASDGMDGDWFGYSGAISGNTVVIGAPQVTVSRFNQGAAYVFVKPKSGWSNMKDMAKLTVFNSAANAQLGLSVAINGDTVIVGAPGAASRAGAAYVFVRPKAGWKTTSRPNAKFLPSNGGGLFGLSIAVSADTAFVGAPLATVGSNADQGVTFVFVKPKRGWTNMTPTAALTASDGQAGDGLGVSVATTGDTVVAGAYGATIGNNVAQGAAYVFEKPTNGWSNSTQVAKLVASDGVAEDRLGVSVSIGDKMIAAGAPNKTVGSNAFQGAVYVFVEPTTGWSNMTQTAELTSSDGEANDAFGYGLAVNGNQIVAGAPFAQIGSNQYQGAAYIYLKPKNGWTTTSNFNAKLTAADGAADDNFGFSVTSIGNKIVSGAPGEYPGDSTAGAAYVFEK
jgi:hypothetical protein